MILNSKFWSGKKVLITGHTGFKGSWMSVWLSLLGAEIYGYSLNPPTNPSLYDLLGIQKLLRKEQIADIGDFELLKAFMAQTQPEILFHLAAQPLVRESYSNPLTTIMTNVIGTANVLEAARVLSTIKVFVNVTTDKCYDNIGFSVAYNENNKLGGNDVYSASKAASELLSHAYRRSFYQKNFTDSRVRLATARAGNVIGGGDFAKDRLIPDIVRAIDQNHPVILRNPESVRPWQHVLDPLH